MESELERCQRVVDEGNAQLREQLQLIDTLATSEDSDLAVKRACDRVVEILAFIRLAEQQLELERTKAGNL